MSVSDSYAFCASILTGVAAVAVVIYTLLHL